MAAEIPLDLETENIKTRVGNTRPFLRLLQA